jgi:hypothetical protein
VVTPQAQTQFIAPPPPIYGYNLNQPLQPPGTQGSAGYYGYSPYDQYPPPPMGKKKKKKAPEPVYGPRTFRIELGGMGVLHSYCARPGVTRNCWSYDNLPPGARPAGPTADYDWNAAYPGGVISAELFPLAGMDSIWLRGLGLMGGYARGWANSQQAGTTAGGQPTNVPVSSIDERWSVMATSRYYFGWQDNGPVNGFVGIKFGYVGRGFFPDLPAGVFLPATQRHLWALGLDLQIPFSWWMKLELGGMYYFNAGVSEDDAIALGPQTGSLGFSFNVGLVGDFAANFPLGYFARVQWDGFNDQFGPSGTAWPAGGVSQETYVTFSAGISLSF